jgi:hypothetical protein
MENASYTLAKIEELYQTTMRPVLIDPSNAFNCFLAFIKIAYPQTERMTPEALAFLHEREQAMLELAGKMKEQMPDGLPKRRLERQMSAAKGKHLQASRLVSNFSRLAEVGALVSEGHDVFLKALQRLLDFMHDISAKSHNGPAAFARISLLYWAVDELTAANFLARRGYTTLTYPHLRCVMEIIDKVELFTKKPELVDTWASGDEEHKIWRELSPPKVRTLLGRDNKDPMYSLFSHMGAHSTFTAVQTRSTAKYSSSGMLRVGIGVGGRQNPAEQAALMGYCVLFCNVCSMHASLAFPEDLNADEVRIVSEAVASEQFGYWESLASAFPNIEHDPTSSLFILVGAWKAMKLKEGSPGSNTR